MHKILSIFYILLIFMSTSSAYAGTALQNKVNVAPQSTQQSQPVAQPTMPQGAQVPNAPAPIYDATPIAPVAPAPNTLTPEQLKAKQEEEKRKAIQGNKKEAMEAYKQGKFARAHTLWIELAKVGDGESMNNLGMLYDTGQGVPQNSKEALTWFRKSSEHGYAGGMSNLGRMLEQGRGTSRHADTAAVWFRKAAELGQADAQFNLGVLYERGEGVIQNDKYAASWYSLAATNGQVQAQARLGHLYRVGRGVEKNLSRATLLLYGASMSGHSKAKEDLFNMAKEHFADKGLPRVTLFGAELSGAKSITRANMRSSLAVAGVKPVREDTNFICDVYNLQGHVPGANEMAVCYGSTSNSATEQPLGFLKIDYNVSDKTKAAAIQKMVESRFGAPSAQENDNGALWNLGPVIVATQYVPESNQVGLMYMLPNIYHLTQANKQANIK